MKINSTLEKRDLFWAYLAPIMYIDTTLYIMFEN